MSQKTMVSKKQRSTNFTFYEKELLLKHALQNHHILENKESNAVTWKNKQKCRLKITELYNSETTGCVRIVVLLCFVCLK